MRNHPEGWLLCRFHVMQLAIFILYSPLAARIKEQQQEQNDKEQNSAIVTQEITASSFCHYGGLLSTRELT